MKTRGKYILAVGVALTSVFGIYAAKDDFGLSRNMEIMLSFMRETATKYVDPTKPDELMMYAAAGMTQRLDPYTVYIPEEEMSDFEVLTTGRYGGIGALIRQDSNFVRIAEPYFGSPADKVGLKVGDVILSIDGNSAEGFKTQDVSSRLKGEPGTTVTVGVRRIADGREAEYKIRRERISIPSVTYCGYVSPGIGYIRHADFTDTCYDEVRAAIEELQTKGELRGLIMDYRSNGGGVMQSAVKVLSLFLPKGTHVLSTKGRSEEEKRYSTEYEPLLPTTPVVALINSASASAAEIVAGALQDYDRAVIVGQRSFGKGLVQTTFPLGYNAYAKITTAKYYIPSGRCIQAIKYGADGTMVAVPDSLVKQFTTSHGRKVYDGGGIMPDFQTPVEYMSSYATALYLSGVVDDFGDQYYASHPEGIGDPKEFSINDTDYAKFRSMVVGKKIKFKSESRREMEKLRKTLEKESFSADAEKIEEMTRLLADDPESNLARYRTELTEDLNANIILRYAYARGVMANAVPRDKDIRRSTEILTSDSVYTATLSSKDTVKR